MCVSRDGTAQSAPDPPCDWGTRGLQENCFWEQSQAVTLTSSTQTAFLLLLFHNPSCQLELPVPQSTLFKQPIYNCTRMSQGSGLEQLVWNCLEALFLLVLIKEIVSLQWIWCHLWDVFSNLSCFQTLLVVIMISIIFITIHHKFSQLRQLKLFHFYFLWSSFFPHLIFTLCFFHICSWPC